MGRLWLRTALPARLPSRPLRPPLLAELDPDKKPGRLNRPGFSKKVPAREKPSLGSSRRYGLGAEPRIPVGPFGFSAPGCAGASLGAAGDEDPSETERPKSFHLPWTGA